MASMDRADKYSRLVLWLKVTLPLVALVILSTLFFIAETLDPESAIPYAEVDVDRILREKGMTRPAFGGVTSKGVRVSIAASSVKPVSPGGASYLGETLSAVIVMPGSGQIEVSSPKGTIESKLGLTILSDGAVLKSTTGYVVETQEIVASLRDASVFAKETVNATGPAGQLTAGAMELRTQTNGAESYLLVFKDGVQLLYDPQP